MHSDSPKPSARRPHLSFAQWQARSLLSRDVAFGVFLLLVYIVYLYRTAPLACSSNSTEAPGLQHLCIRQQQQQQQKWQFLWQLVCNNTSAFSYSNQGPGLMQQTTADGWLGVWHKILGTVVHIRSNLKALVSDMFKLWLQAVAALLGAGLLSGDIMHIIMLPLRLGSILVILFPLPYINPCRLFKFNPHPSSSSSSSSSRSGLISWYRPTHYWQYPWIRCLVVMGQRLLPPIATAASLSSSVMCTNWVAMEQEGGALTKQLVKYAFTGWSAAILMLPLRVQLLWGFAEWLIVYSNSVRPNILLSGSSSSGSSSGGPMMPGFLDYLDITHLMASFVLIIAIPGVIVWALEKHQKQRYQRMQQGVAAAAAALGSQVCKDTDAAAAAAGGVDLSGSSPEKMKGWKTSSSSSSSGGGIKKAAPAQNGSMVTAAEAGLAAAAAEVQANPTDAGSDSSSSNACKRGQLSDQVGPLLQSLLPEEDTADILAAAAAAAGSSDKAVRQYAGLCTTVPMSIKVHGHGHSVSTLGPVLSSILHYQLAPYNTAAAPLGIHAAAFTGCVQLIANVFGLRQKLGSLDQAGGSSSSDGSSSSSVDLAGSLLDTVIKQLAGITSHRDLDHSCSAAAAAAMGPDSSSSSSLTVRPDQPEVDVAVGGTVASTHRSPDQAAAAANGRSGSSSGGSAFAVALESCDPACLIADQPDQQIRLQLKLSGLSGPQGDLQPDCQDSGFSGPVRLLVFRDEKLLADEEKYIGSDGIITQALPAQESGVLHLALLPSRRPAAAAAAAAGAADTMVDQALANNPRSTVPYAPLLLLPLLVLPEAAAAEVEQYYQELLNTPAAAAANASDTVSSSDTTTEAHKRAWQSVLALHTDIAYILTACAAAKEQQQQQQQMPIAVREVFKHLLIHLASCRMFCALQFVVETAAAAYARGYAGNSRSSSTKAAASAAAAVPAMGSSSNLSKDTSSGSSSSSEIKPLKISNPGTCTAMPAAAAAAGSNSSDGHAGTTSCSRVKVSELLWGFTDPSLEAKYQAAAFSSSGLLDFVIFVYMTGIGLGCYYDRSPNGNAMQSAGQAAAASGSSSGSGVGWSAGLILSQLVIIAVTMSGSIPVMILRWKVARNLHAVAQQQQQQQRGLQQDANHAIHQTPLTNSSSKLAAAAPQQQQQQQGSAAAASIGSTTLDLITQQLAAAARRKQIYHMIWITSAVIWVALLALSDVLVKPAYMIRLWSERSWTQDLGAIFSVAIKGYMDQVPFAWFIPVIVSLTTTHILGCLVHGLKPLYWLVIRHVPMLMMPLVIAARQNVTGRMAFCRRNGVSVE